MPSHPAMLSAEAIIAAMADEAYLKSKLDLTRLLLKNTHLELNVFRAALATIAEKYPAIDVDSVLSFYRTHSELQKQTEQEWERTAGLLDKYDGGPLDEALEAFEKWNPPKSSPN